MAILIEEPRRDPDGVDAQVGDMDVARPRRTGDSHERDIATKLFDVLNRTNSSERVASEILDEAGHTPPRDLEVQAI